MIGHFRTVDPGQVRPQLAAIAARARAGRGRSQIEIHDLTIRCLLGPERDAEGHIRQLVPVFDAIFYGPPASWRRNPEAGVKFTSRSIDAMERWIELRRGDWFMPPVQAGPRWAVNSEGLE